MGQYSKSKKVLQRAWEKFKDSFRWNTGNLRVYEFQPVIDTGVKEKSTAFENRLTDFCLTFPQIDIREDALGETRVMEESTEFVPVITAETPPEQIEAAIIEECLGNMDTEISAHSMANMETEAKELDPTFNTSADIKGLKISRPEAAIKKLTFRDVDSFIKDGDNVLAQVPISRNSLSVFTMSAPARMAYWKEIVEQTGKRPAELDLLGIFAHVPVQGMTKASIDQTTGVLRLWYSPDQKKNRSATLLIARDRNTKELVRVFDRRTLS